MAFNLKEWNKNRDKAEGKESVRHEAAEHKSKKPDYKGQVKQAFGFTSGFGNLKKKSLSELVGFRK